MILCCGEALIDMLPRETAAGETAFAPYAGGAVFNTAIALGRLEVPVGFCSGISNDLFGQILIDGLTASGVDSTLAVRSDRPTTLAFVTLKNGQASYAFYDENTALRMMAIDDLPTLPDAITALFFGGISLVGGACADANAALLAREHASRVTMIDPNIRPGFVTDATAYRARLGSMLAQSDIVKLSDEDLTWLMGPGEIPALAAAVLDQGPKVVIITEGADGARAFTARDTVHAPAQRVAVVDTVGAGDTFNAGFLAALHDAGQLSKAAVARVTADTLRAALALGGQAAAVTVARAGANPPRRAEL